MQTPIARPRLVSLGVKVPEVTALFWLAKLLTTGMGEACSDWLGNAYNPVLVGPVLVVVLGAALWWQFRTPRYLAWVYWFAITMVAVVGTAVADLTHVIIGVPYEVSTAVFAVLLGVLLTAWYRSEGTLSIHSITTRRRERFYWLTVMCTFALGTAAGDLTAVNLHLGFFWSGILFLAAFLVPALGYWKLRLHPVIAFWAAYVLTRPLGASFADWFGKPHSLTGLGLGDGQVTGLATLGIVAVVAVLARRQRVATTAAEPREEDPQAAAEGAVA